MSRMAWIGPQVLVQSRRGRAVEVAERAANQDLVARFRAKPSDSPFVHQSSAVQLTIGIDIGIAGQNGAAVGMKPPEDFLVRNYDTGTPQEYPLGIGVPHREMRAQRPVCGAGHSGGEGAAKPRLTSFQPDYEP